MDIMNSALALLVPVTIASVTYNPEQYSFWERIAEKWGIGAVGLGLFIAYAYVDHKKQAAKDIKEAEKAAEEKKERQKREDDAQAERKALLEENNKLQKELLDHMVGHAKTLEGLIKDGNTAANNQAMEIKNLARKMQGKPCVRPNESDS